MGYSGGGICGGICICVARCVANYADNCAICLSPGVVWAQVMIHDHAHGRASLS